MFCSLEELFNPKYIVASASPVASGSGGDRVKEVLKRIRVQLVHDEEEVDSEEFPTELIVSSMADLKEQIADVVVVNSGTMMRVILNRSEQIVTIDKLVDGGSYTVQKKVKPGIVKIYFDTKIE